MKRRIPFLVAIVAGLFSSTDGVFADDALPKDWKPHLDMVTRSIEKDLGRSSAQQEMNLLSGLLAQVKDAELAIVYLSLYSSLGEKKQKQLKSEQSKWLKKRDQAVEELGPHGSSRGSIAPMEDNQLFVDLTEKRIKELRRRSK